MIQPISVIRRQISRIGLRVEILGRLSILVGLHLGVEQRNNETDYETDKPQNVEWAVLIGNTR